MTQVTIQQAFELAVQHHQAGRLGEAEGIYRQILMQQPESAVVVRNLGLLAHQAGRNDEAIELLRRAVAINPGYAEAYSNLGSVLKDSGQLVEAVAAYRRAIELDANLPAAFNNLGAALIDLGESREAADVIRRAIALQPTLPEAHHNLGMALRNIGQYEAGIAALRRAIELRPDYAEAYWILGHALRGAGKLAGAIDAFRRAIGLRPDFAEAYNALVEVLKEAGELDEAIAVIRQAIVLWPGYGESYTSLGTVLKMKGQADEAITTFRQAIALNPALAEAHNNLANSLKERGEIDEAIASYRRAIALKPNYADAYNNLGNALKETARMDEAVAAFREAVALDPQSAAHHSNLVYTLYFHRDYDLRMIAEELRRWNKQHAEPLGKFVRAHHNDRNADRRLRVGYVSPDMRNHCQAFFMLPLLEHHDREQVTVYCYSTGLVVDQLAARHQKLADVWRDCRGIADQNLAELIRADQIDVLVDLTLHMANHRLLVFARKPAPVQVTWLGYPGSTGLSAIDYRLSDPHIDPVDRDESIYSEKTVRLPDTFWCFDPLDGREIGVNALPAKQAGFVTFGCLNNFCKINDTLLWLWAQVLKRVENSRLLLLAPEGKARERILEKLQREGIDSTRVDFSRSLPLLKYLENYHRIDIGLDSYPYNGHTTSLDSFWMGVPVVTLVGNSAVSRAGWCQLSNLGLSELAGQTPEQFVEIAVALAKDLPRLSELRRTLRARMEKSPLMDARKFAQNIEAAYRQMWRAWCETDSVKS